MKSLLAHQIRTTFTDFYLSKQHQKVRSSSLIPANDPTVLLTTAGMQQFKPYFMNEQKAPAPRLTSVQKCFRTSDIDEVGDASHCTFFEMLGNFSVGDYFKNEAIDFGWELLTEHFNIPADRLSITIFGGENSIPPDEEAKEIWKSKGVPEERIIPFGSTDNFWGPPGTTGPCGPCSEIHYDLSKTPCELGAGCGPNCSCGRFLEIWNLVFMQYNKLQNGSFEPLPKKNIDTGMGLERIALVLQGKPDIFATDLFSPLIVATGDICNLAMETPSSDVLSSLRIISDHIRGATFLVSDGVLPSNEGRGYVLRRILRRAMVHGRRLEQKEPFINRLLEVVLDIYGTAYPELSDNHSFISRVFHSEEERFLETLDTGIRLFQIEQEKIKKSPHATFPGHLVFKLYDTFGFPPELTEDMAQKGGLKVDRAGFEQCMEEQREKARASWQGNKQGDLAQEAELAVVPTEFIGYERCDATSIISYILTEGRPTDIIKEGTEAQIIAPQTPFYAESGGQVGDQGIIQGPDGLFKVLDTRQGPGNMLLHQGKVTQGQFADGQEIIFQVDREMRLKTSRNHTATHLLQYALRTILGDHIRQSGSFVTPDRLRFDFTHFTGLQEKEIEAVEALVNEKIIQNCLMDIRFLSFQEAQDEKAIALFGEKYGDIVRLVNIEDYSKELCGGTHVSKTGEIGFFKITHESSVAAGVRRIEALTGEASLKYTQHLEREYRQVSSFLQAKPGELVQRVQQLQKRLKSLEKEMKGNKSVSLKDVAKKFSDNAETVNSISLVAAEYDAEVASLRKLADLVRDRLQSGVIILGSRKQEKATLILSVTKNLIPRLHAGNLIREVAKEVGGSGGGKPDMAQAGGISPEMIQKAFKKLKRLIETS